jgi:hypothetical protein
MGKTQKRPSQDLPKTWSADRGGSAVLPSEADVRKDRPDDEGIRPDKLNSENDQGAG